MFSYVNEFEMQIAFNMDDNGERGRDKIRSNTSCRQSASGKPASVHIQRLGVKYTQVHFIKSHR